MKATEKLLNKLDFITEYIQFIMILVNKKEALIKFQESIGYKEN